RRSSTRFPTAHLLRPDLHSLPTRRSSDLVHASLLPKHRGGAPIHRAVINGDDETGVTLMYMAKKLDAGDIIASRSIKIEDSDNTGTMFDKLSRVGASLLMDKIGRRHV